MDQLQKAATQFIEPEPPPVKKKSKQPVVITPSLKEMASQLAAPVPATTLDQLRRLIAPFVGEALLGAVYAAMLDLAVDLDAFNPDLVRNHDFGADPWGNAEFDTTRKAVRGSVARLGFALSQLESRSPHFTGPSASVLAPSPLPFTATILNSYQLVDHRWVTPQAAEFVARSIDLGEDALALSSLNDPTAQTIINRLEKILSPRRTQTVRAWLDQGEIKKAIDELTPSELYSLGQRYVNLRLRPDDPSASNLKDEPGALGALAKMNIKSQPSGPGSEIPEPLRSELRQFGMTMMTRAGLVRLDLGELEPYEQALTFREGYRLAERMQDLKLAIARTCYRQGDSTPLPLSLTLARQTLQRTIETLREATGGTPPPERDWQDIVLAIQAFDERRLAFFLTKLAESPYARPVPAVKWSDEAGR